MAPERIDIDKIYAQEWPDLITCLQRVAKTLRKYEETPPLIPEEVRKKFCLRIERLVLLNGEPLILFFPFPFCF